VRQSASAVAGTQCLDAIGMVEIQRGMVRRREFRPLGRLEKITLGENAVPHADTSNPLWKSRVQEVSLDWQNKGPLIGVANNSDDILICSPMIHPPDLPDPTWTQPRDSAGRIIPAGMQDGFPVPQVPPRIPQRLRDRCYGQRDGWLIFQPLSQALFILHDRTGLGLIKFSADYQGNHAVLLYDPKREEGHIVFGLKQIDELRS
jgi:hypothetical protein